MNKPKNVEEARKMASKVVNEDLASFGFRSCWNCNGAHEHLKEASYPFNCFECGHWFFMGFDITESNERSNT